MRQCGTESLMRKYGPWLFCVCAGVARGTGTYSHEPEGDRPYELDNRNGTYGHLGCVRNRWIGLRSCNGYDRPVQSISSMKT